ncbi:MAG: glycosyltransferase family 2 protein [Candidatus Nanoarchaeia archaeon]
METKDPEISIILPCLNEEKAIGSCLMQIKEVIKKHNLNAEVIIVDNGSADNSLNAIKEHGKGIRGKVVIEKTRGYGSAYLKGFSLAKGKYLFMADSDGTYDFNEIPNFINELKKGYDFVIGNRFKKTIESGAMPFLHRYIGNPLLSGILRLFFRAKVHDSHSGMRAITRTAFDSLKLQTLGMEFASEMVIKAGKNNLKIKEIPIEYRKRKGDSKLRSFKDGWRHLRFMLLYSPLWLFFIPGITLILIGLIYGTIIYFGQPISGIIFEYHPLFVCSILIMTGYQLILFSLFARTYLITHLNEKPVFNWFYKHLTLEKGALAGLFIIILGLSIYISILIDWINKSFSAIEETKKSIIALTFITIGIQTIFSSFVLSILGIKEKQN